MSHEIIELQDYLEQIEKQIELRTVKLENLQQQLRSLSETQISAQKIQMAYQFQFAAKNRNAKKIEIANLQAKIVEAQQELFSAQQRKLQVEQEISELQEV